MSKYYYLTTAIDYTNGEPHIGHAYEKILADCVHRFQKTTVKKSFFLTGVDQHGQKVQQSAKKQGVDEYSYVQTITRKFQQCWQLLDVQYDGWAETVSDEHKACVQSILHALNDKGYLYKKRYQGYYSIRQEQFLTDKDQLPDGSFDSKWGEVELRDEENYYFKLSAFKNWYQQFLAKNNDFVLPHWRKKELLNAVEGMADIDLCISRPKSRLHWGIELPFDQNYVTFVWFDALINYISFAGYLKEKNTQGLAFEQLWPANIHIIGKDILVPSHGIYWPIMLHAMGFEDNEIPSLLVHGWWNIAAENGGDNKISKSLNNAPDLNKIIATFGGDAVRFYLLSAIHTGKDATFDIDNLITRYNVSLANGLGNLLSRTVKMLQKFNQGILKHSDWTDTSLVTLKQSFQQCKEEYLLQMDRYMVSHAIDAVTKFISDANSYAEINQPWVIGKDNSQQEKLHSVLWHMLESVYLASILLSPIIPNSIAKLLECFTLEKKQLDIRTLDWGELADGMKIQPVGIIFPRI